MRKRKTNMAIRKTFTNFEQTKHEKWGDKEIQSFTLIHFGGNDFTFGANYDHVLGGTGVHSGGFTSLYDFHGNPDMGLERRTGLKWDSLKNLVDQCQHNADKILS